MSQWMHIVVATTIVYILYQCYFHLYKKKKCLQEIDDWTDFFLDLLSGK